MSKLAPRRYGDRLLLAGEAQNPARVLYEQVSWEKLTPEQLDALETVRDRQRSRSGANQRNVQFRSDPARVHGGITNHDGDPRGAAHVAAAHGEGRRGSTGARTNWADSVLLVPGDVNEATLAKAIEAKLRASGNSVQNRSGGLLALLARTRDGRLAVPQVVLERLGTGNAAPGEQRLVQLMSEMRRRRVLVASRTRQR